LFSRESKTAIASAWIMSEVVRLAPRITRCPVNSVRLTAGAWSIWDIYCARANAGSCEAGATVKAEMQHIEPRLQNAVLHSPSQSANVSAVNRCKLLAHIPDKTTADKNGVTLGQIRPALVWIGTYHILSDILSAAHYTIAFQLKH
jgi:hypothetical protein